MERYWHGTPVFCNPSIPRQGLPINRSRTGARFIASSFGIGGERALMVGLDSTNVHIQKFVRRQSHQKRTLYAYFSSKSDCRQSARLSELRMPDRFGTPTRCEFVRLSTLPVTKTGEINREEPPGSFQKSEEFLAPRTELETRLAGIWEDVMGMRGVSIRDNFFQIGGHSLLATRVVSRIRCLFQVNFPLRQLFEFPTIEQLAEVIENRLLDELGEMPEQTDFLQ